MAWWLLDSVIKGTLEEDYPIMSKNKKDVVTFGATTIVGAAGNDTIEIKGAGDYVPDQDFWKEDGHSLVGNPYYGDASSDTITFTGNGVGAADTVSFTGSRLLGGMGEDRISFTGGGGTAYDDPKYYAFGDDPYPTVGSGSVTVNADDIYKHHFPAFPSYKNVKPLPDLKYKSQKYGEDKGIADLKDYVSSTYQGHYTNDSSDVQTLDLIHSVGDAESFCRSNALKYLSRYDKKGQAKRDILKAMHYCLLLYYFSGQTNNETPTRGYETF